MPRSVVVQEQVEGNWLAPCAGQHEMGVTSLELKDRRSARGGRAPAVCRHGPCITWALEVGSGGGFSVRRWPGADAPDKVVIQSGIGVDGRHELPLPDVVVPVAVARYVVELQALVIEVHGGEFRPACPERSLGCLGSRKTNEDVGVRSPTGGHHWLGSRYTSSSTGAAICRSRAISSSARGQTATRTRPSLGWS